MQKFLIQSVFLFLLVSMVGGCAESESGEDYSYERYRRIKVACILDKGVGLNMDYIWEDLTAICKAIAEDPTWLESLKYDDERVKDRHFDY